MNMAASNLDIKERFESIKGNIGEVLSQIFNQKFKIAQTINEDLTPEAFFADEEYPRVFIALSTQGKYAIDHLLSLPQDLVLQLYAWMLMADDLDKEIQDEHIEGIQEGVDQILGQIRTLVGGEEVEVSLSDAQLSLLKDAESVAFDLKDKAGATATYKLSVGKKKFEIRHYLISDFEISESNADPEQDLIDEHLGTDDPSSNSPEVDVHSVEFGDFDQKMQSGTGQGRNIDMLLDVQLEVLVELGRKTMLVKDVLKLGKGSVVELNKSAGEPLDILINGRKLAEGEVVVVDDSFGIRITSLASESERIKSLG